MSFLLMLLALFVTVDSFADAEARRTNKCRNQDRRYIVRHARVNGPTSSCPRHVQDDRSCDKEVEKRVSNFVDGNCICFFYFSPGLSTAEESWAVSGPNRLFEQAVVYTSCRGFRAGSNKLLSDNLNAPNENGVAITNKATLQGTTEVYDYDNNTYTLNNFSGDLHISAPDLLNHYAIIRIEIVKVNTDANGVETDQVLASSQAKIINGQFVAPLQGSAFSQSDFAVTQSNGEIKASFSFESKTINLNYDITADMDLEVRMIGDAGNIEDGESEVEIDPVSMIVLTPSNSQATFQIVSDTNRNGTLIVRNASGIILSTQSNITLTQNQTSEFTFTTSNDSTTPFYVVQFISSDGIIIVRKFMLH